MVLVASNRGLTRWVGLGLVALAALAGVIFLQEENRQIESEIAQARHEAAALPMLEVRLTQAAAERVSSEELAQLRKEHAEIGQLRAHLAKLRNDTVVNELYRRAIDSNRPRPRDSRESNSSAPNPFASDHGRSSPMNTLASIVWAANTGNVDALAEAITFDPVGRERAEKAFEQLPENVRADYNNAEKVYATLIAAAIPLGLTKADVMQQAQSTNGDIDLTLNLQRKNGSGHTAWFKFRRAGDTWQMVVPDSVVLTYSKALKG